VAVGLSLPAPIAVQATEPVPSSVLAFGLNQFGEVGDGTTTERATLVSLPGMDSISAVAAGFQHSLALRSDGRVLAWGRGLFGALGDGTTTDRSVPTLVPDLTDVVAIDAGVGYSLAIRSDGSVWEWGRRTWGEPDQLVPAQAGQIVASRIGTGYEHRLAITDAGVQTWGTNGYFKLGDGTQTTRWTPGPAPLFDGAVQAEGGYGHSVVLRPNGTVQTIGLNDYGQLGAGTILENGLRNVFLPGGMRQIAAGDWHTLALASDNTVWAWGRGDSGALCAGDNRFVNQSTPQHLSGLSGVTKVAAGTVATLALNAAGVSICGAFLRPNFTLMWSSGDLELLPGTAGATDMAAGNSHALVLVHGVPLASASSTAITAQSDPNPAHVSAPVHVTVTVAPVPDGGSVTVGNTSGTAFATATIDPSTGVATFDLSFAAVGTYPLYFEYHGTARFLGSTTELEQSVVVAATSLSVQSDANPAYVSAPVHIMSTVSPVPNGGSVTVGYSPGTAFATATVSSSTGVATFNLTFAAVGTYPLYFEYHGTPGYLGSTAELDQSVVASPTSLLVRTDANPAYVSASVHLAATVSPVPDGGSVTVGHTPGTQFATATVDSSTGVATFDLTFDAAGTYPLYFEYLGTSNFLGSTAQLNQSIIRRTTTTTLAARSVPPFFAPAVVTLDVAVTPAPGSGTVEVFDGPTSLGTASMNWTTGTGSFITPALAAGTHQLLARYLGNAGYGPSTSPTIALVVEADTIPPTTTAPVMTMLAGTTSSLTDVPVQLSWTASDVRGVVASQDLEESVDGGAWVPIPVAASTRSNTRLLSWTHTYRYRVRATDDSGNVGSFSESSVIDLDIFQESSNSVAYKGPWPQMQSSWALGGRRRYSEKIGSTATFQFTGQAVVWVAVTGSDRGQAQVFVDGVDAGTIDLSAPTMTPRWLAFARTWPAAGSHTIQLVVIGGPNKSVIDLDAFIVRL
jgi:hypothetical protein